MRTILLAGALAATAFTTQAAEIKDQGAFPGKDGVQVHGISIEGRIVKGDGDKFERIAKSFTGIALVGMNSPGGLIIEGIQIGETIHDRGFVTAVPDNATCASTCGLMWLAGKRRFLSSTSRVGFHAASIDGEVTSAGNALIGAYLGHMDLSYAAISYLTNASPDSMAWLHPDQAKKYGIAFEVIDPDPAPSQAFSAPAPTPAPTSPAPATSTASAVERAAASLVVSYYYDWSRGGTDVEMLGHYYGDTVSFYGNSITKAKVMDEKRKFSARWPVRSYTVNPTSLYAQCSDVCIVSGVVSWDVTSTERGAHSVGQANFAYRIVNGVIVSENGSVLTAKNDTADQQQAASTPAYVQGRQARLEYEQWYAALTDGPFRDGATFWATHRSDKPPPSCAAGNSQFIAGCVAAKYKLTPIDARRSAEKDFWYGLEQRLKTAAKIFDRRLIGSH